jgi:CIC family chloride channel protein
MLAVAIATFVSRALSYGTIYTTKLLRRGSDIDQAAPWRAVADLKITDVMRPFSNALPVPPDSGGGAAAVPAEAGSAPDGHDGTALPGPVSYRHDVQVLFASESLGQALRQLAVYGRDGLPVVSADERQLEGWVTSAGVLQALARRVAGTAGETAQAAADQAHEDLESVAGHPAAPLPGYYVAEITIAGDSPAAGRKLGDLTWPAASVPVSVLRSGSLRPASAGLTLAAADRVSLLVPAPAGTRPLQRRSTDPGHAARSEASSGACPSLTLTSRPRSATGGRLRTCSTALN